MSRSLFRKAALERLASPEQLDRSVRLVGSLAWLGFLGVAVAVVGAIAWAVQVEVPVKVASRGILIQDGGLLELTASQSGRLESLLISTGQAVRKGDVIARVAQPDLRRQLTNAEADLSSARARLERLESVHRQMRAREQAAAEARVASLEQTAARLDRRLALLERKRRNIVGLVAKKALPEDKLLDAEVAEADVRERIAALADERTGLGLQRLDRLAAHDMAQLDQSLEVDALERERDRLARRADELEQIKSPHDGRIAELRVNAGAIIRPGSGLATLVADVGGKASELHALLYVAPADGKQVMPGMRVEIAPTTHRREEHGYMLGEVTAVSELPATLAGMRRQLQNDQLVRQLSGAGAPFEARVTLLRNAGNPSGFEWSSSSGPGAEINAGTLFEGRVIVRRVRLASLLLPELQKYLDGP